MNQTLALWIIGGLLAVVGFLVVRILRVVDETNKLVAEQGLSSARLEVSVGHLTHDVRSLTQWRQEVTNRALEDAAERVRELERRIGPSDRRAAE